MVAHDPADHSPGLVRTLCKAFGGQPTPPCPPPAPPSFPTSGPLSRYCPHSAASPWRPRPPLVRAVSSSPPSRPARESSGRAGPRAASLPLEPSPHLCQQPLATLSGLGCPGCSRPRPSPRGATPRSPHPCHPPLGLGGANGGVAGGGLLLHLEAKSGKVLGFWPCSASAFSCRDVLQLRNGKSAGCADNINHTALGLGALVVCTKILHHLRRIRLSKPQPRVISVKGLKELNF